MFVFVNRGNQCCMDQCMKHDEQTGSSNFLRLKKEWSLQKFHDKTLNS